MIEFNATNLLQLKSETNQKAYIFFFMPYVECSDIIISKMII